MRSSWNTGVKQLNLKSAFVNGWRKLMRLLLVGFLRNHYSGVSMQRQIVETPVQSAAMIRAALPKVQKEEITQ